MKKIVIGVAAASLATTSANAEGDSIVTAADPQGMVDVLEGAGYDPVLGTDKTGDPRITMLFGGREGVLFFYGCDENTNDKCDAVQFNIGFDRKQPWKADDALKLSEKFRFVAPTLDNEGDPFISWDVITGNGIPAKVFLRSVLAFNNIVRDVETVVFADE